eukprot:scpid82727/ scgid14407/ 
MHRSTAYTSRRTAPICCWGCAMAKWLCTRCLADDDDTTAVWMLLGSGLGVVLASITAAPSCVMFPRCQSLSWTSSVVVCASVPVSSWCFRPTLARDVRACVCNVSSSRITCDHSITAA